MQGIALSDCEIGTVSSMKDGSVKFTVYTAELRPSERGTVMEYHGKACAVVVKPHDDNAPEIVRVDTERSKKSQSQRIHAVLFLVWKRQGEKGTFEAFYNACTERWIDECKELLGP